MSSLDLVISALISGDIIGYPSEGVWGLGCDPNNQSAVKKLLKIKKRSPNKGFILVGSDMSHLEKFAPTEKYTTKLNSTWPGAHTWIFPDSHAPKWITGERNSIAMRLSNHPAIISVCDAFFGAIVSTSANEEGSPPSKSFTEVRKIFPEVAFLEGRVGNLNGATPIQDIVSDSWIRRGKT